MPWFDQCLSGLVLKMLSLGEPNNLIWQSIPSIYNRDRTCRKGEFMEVAIYMDKVPIVDITPIPSRIFLIFAYFLH